MSFMDSMQSGLERFMGPFAQKLSESKIISALTAGMMSSMPITLGVAAFAILGNLPFEPWQAFLASTGMGPHMLDIVAGTSSLLAAYIVPTIAYHYAKNEKENGLTAAVLALASFIVLQPQNIIVGEASVAGLTQSNMGSNGIFVGMITAIAVAASYSALMKKNIKLKLPSSVPPNVSESLSPTFVSMILFLGVFVVRYAAGLTSYGNIFDLVANVVSKPVMLFGANPWSLILFHAFMNLCWFFGIHPAPILSVYIPVLMSAGTANTEAFLAGTPSSELPYLTFSVLYGFCYIGGTGSTLSLAFSMFTAKSERYKVFRNVAVVPNIFNINEPMIFGMPIMLNPLFFIPMILASLVGGLMGIFALDVLGVGSAFNPTISLPWVMPPFVGPFITGGWKLGLAIIAVIFVQMFIWYPFFKIADNQALKEEQAAQA
ncbi:PTS system, cellobiose-specific IIC component [Streptococcus henryi]|jgi:PTS system cellobiose-specific IIC component|uniref:Permease IIC component n=1 Tax=Streptococcus henryi TaxID=439219 RepID=A0A1G6AT38_9STRE|nr:PTS transporter subunit EIIC [Streptococcus henryi]SDB11353.1 PTS system, cellobiose-specific IIC component [Streptococcus henryi]